MCVWVCGGLSSTWKLSGHRNLVNLIPNGICIYLSLFLSLYLCMYKRDRERDAASFIYIYIQRMEDLRKSSWLELLGMQRI